MKRRTKNKIKNFTLITIALAMAIVFIGSIGCIASIEYFSWIPICTMIISGLYLLFFTYINTK